MPTPVPSYDYSGFRLPELTIPESSLIPRRSAEVGAAGPVGPRGTPSPAGAAPRAAPSIFESIFGRQSSVDIGKSFQSSFGAARGTITPRALSVGSGSPFDRMYVPAARGSPKFSVPQLRQQSIDWGASYRGGGAVSGGRAALYLAVAAAVGLVWWKKPWKKAADAAFPG